MLESHRKFSILKSSSHIVIKSRKMEYMVERITTSIRRISIEKVSYLRFSLRNNFRQKTLNLLLMRLKDSQI
jgi:hypothetical protein